MRKSLPLEGIKVIELATVVAAPAASRLLSDFGAEVIKIEPTENGDSLRVIGDMHQLPTDADNNPMFDLFNTGKKLISINLKSEEGKQLLFRLLSDADVFLTNTRMRSLQKMGLGYDELKYRFPRLIYAHFSGFGLDGPDRDRAGFDSSAFWLRPGICIDMVRPGDFPARPPYAFGDIASASYFLNGILMAIIARERTEHGTLISTSLFGSGIWMSAPYVVNTQEKYGKQLPAERDDPWSPFSDIYECSDGIYIAPISKRYPSDRPMLAKVFGMPELVEDPDLRSLGAMRRAGKLAGITDKLAAIMLTKTSAQWAAVFTENDIPYEVTHHIKDIPNDRQAIENGYIESIEYPDGITAVPVPPIKYSDYGRREFTKQRSIGADTDDVLLSLGYAETEIAALRRGKVIR